MEITLKIQDKRVSTEPTLKMGSIVKANGTVYVCVGQADGTHNLVNVMSGRRMTNDRESLRDLWQHAKTSYGPAEIIDPSRVTVVIE